MNNYLTIHEVSHLLNISECATGRIRAFSQSAGQTTITVTIRYPMWWKSPKLLFIEDWEFPPEKWGISRNWILVRIGQCWPKLHPLWKTKLPAVNPCLHS